MPRRAVSSVFADQATGCHENPGGLYSPYDDEGNKLTWPEARALFAEGGIIELPNAGAGSYQPLFEQLGAAETTLWESSSSAGDWSFMVQMAKTGIWYPAFQNNRYPYCGFRYSLDSDIGFETEEELREYMKHG